MSEILAPAGNKNAAISAINAGADAIYLGLSQYSARSFADNFSLDDLKEICGFAHVFDVKVYAAMNTVVKQAELQGFLDAVVAVCSAGADAVILQDAYLGKFIKSRLPSVRLHLSTQAGVCNRYGAEFAKQCGFDRVIIARETPLKDIEEIASVMETECFIQGALCTCFSGQCYFSGFVGGNSGNRGKCKQPCRKKYSIDREGFNLPAYRLSLSDLCVGEDIFSLMRAGVTSFKIEGRMRRAEYVAAAVAYYKKILEGGSAEENFRDLKRTYNRGNYTRGLAFGQDKRLISSAVQGHIGDFVGAVCVKNGKFTVETRQTFRSGDCFKILRGGTEVGGAAFYSQNNGLLTLSSREKLKNGDKVFITTDVAVNEKLLSLRATLPVDISAEIVSGKPARMCVNGVTSESEESLPPAKTRPVSRGDVEKCFSKVDGYPFEPRFKNIVADGAFMTAAELNALRRAAYEKLYLSLAKPAVEFPQNFSFCMPEPPENAQKNKKTAVICTDLNGVEADIGILKLPDTDCDPQKLTRDFKGEKYLFLPPFATGEEAEAYARLAQGFDGFYADGYYGVALAEKFKKRLFAGTGLNITNYAALSLSGADYFALSKELTIAEAKPLAGENSFYLAAGDLKIMDLVYCPFGKECKSCPDRSLYNLTDEAGRAFPLRRYKTSACRFELYNCSPLVTDFSGGGLIDCTLSDPQKTVSAYKSGKLTQFYKNYTRGHSAVGVR